MSGDIFISHADEDKRTALDIVEHLKTAGYGTWCFELDCLPGPSHLDQEYDAIESCQAVLVVVSPASLESDEVDAEVIRAHKAHKHLVPLLCGVPFGKIAQRRKGWSMAFEAATGIEVPEGDIGKVAHRVVAGLKALGIERQDDPPTGPRLGDTMAGPDGTPLVWVPPGSFNMGADDIDAAKPVHHVTITEGFWLGKYQVTNAQYREFCRDASREFPKDSNQPDDHPVVCVSWDDAQAYCKYYDLRLPTEAEWEWAARGENGNAYPWGNEWDAARCCNIGNNGPGGSTFEVGHFREAGASWCGAQDMAGNVWEWCQDCYSQDYYEGRPTPDTDPRGPQEPDGARAARGGACDSDQPDCRSARRSYRAPDSPNYNLGFRVALSA